MKIVIECEPKEITELLTLVQVRQKDFDAEIDNWLEKVLHRSVTNDRNQF